GNEMLRRAADLLRDNLPNTAVLARLEDGDMAAGLAEAEQEYAIRLFENIREQYREGNDTGINTDLEYGIAVIRDDSKSVEEALKEASESMHTKKLMNETSQKSSLLDSLTQTLTESDYETEEHVERTREMAVRLGKAINLSDTDLGRLALLAVLHDIGKIAIPHAILLKPGKLTDEEWEVMKSHTEKGYRIASASKELQPIAEYILHHHERWDGKGYPGGQKGEEIPLLSRIITVVDSHDVMVHDRPYHKAMSHEQAVEELLRCSGTQFDPQLVQVFLKVINAEA
ncbi:MAG: HD-GYP domain-containing protein, partial [Lachnospiraceae bacterium]|nr:HD-GYP domain-containing protein [Lachnospiraceae bacterium]